MLIPISRAIKRYGLDVLVMLNAESLERIWDSDEPVSTDYDMFFLDISGIRSYGVAG
jgi:hypothetical protein